MGKGLRSCDRLVWTSEAEEPFANMKVQMTLAPTLGLPNVNCLFRWWMREMGLWLLFSWRLCS